MTEIGEPRAPSPEPRASEAEAEAELADRAVLLLPSQILAAGPWQSRKVVEPVTDGEKEAQVEFEASILEQGVIEPLVVEQDSAGQWLLIAGSRRHAAALKVAPERLILCSMRKRGEGADVDAERRADNIAENTHRKNLRAWELAEALYAFHVANPTMTLEEIGKRTGLSAPRVGELVRFKKRACAELWELYRRYGHEGRITFVQLTRLVAEHSKERQVEAYNRLVVEMKGVKEKRWRGKEKMPGPAKLKKRLAHVPLIPESRDFKHGLFYGLKLALGQMRWLYEDTEIVARRIGEEEQRRRLGALGEELRNRRGSDDSDEEAPSPEP